MHWRDEDNLRWLEAELPGARVAFTTREGGSSGGPYESLNLGLLTGDDPDRVVANRQRAVSVAGVSPFDVLSGHQVHGVELQQRDEAPEPNGFARPEAGLAEADGQVTRTPWLAPLVLVADCLPVALVGSDGLAMLHCGWRGLAGGIVAEGAADVDATAAAIGPGIGPCCYEVGDEVLGAFSELGDGIAEGRMLNLEEIARRLLVEAGVDHVETASLCTSCNEELFFSHRRDGERTGRQAGFAWLEP